MNTPLSRWELAAETIAVKIRWFGILFGYLIVNLGDTAAHRPVLNSILLLGVAYALLDTAYSLKGRIFLHTAPLLISAMEALFISLLCYFDAGLESPFRYYYILSLVCCAIRYTTQITYATWALHSLSFATLFTVLPSAERDPAPLVLTVVLLGWVTWASVALALLLKRVGDHLGRLNRELEEHRGRLEERIAERTRELQASQAHVLHQEKMAAFGLLAAGIAHEVGNPLTSISALVQILQRRGADTYTQDKLALASGQLQRIQTTLRELVNFSRPAGTVPTRVSLAAVVREALDIAKYYKRTKGRRIETYLPDDLPAMVGVRDQLVQVFLNLILNAIDATGVGGCIVVRAVTDDNSLTVDVQDDGTGVAPEHRERLFQPYFTTKKHGTGLGLFVTRKLVEDHGGEVDCRFGADGGTTFSVRFSRDARRSAEPLALRCAARLNGITQAQDD
jgi:two-component system, NtrC family, sensor kinase